jgi:hypothetical protein
MLRAMRMKVPLSIGIFPRWSAKNLTLANAVYMHSKVIRACSPEQHAQGHGDTSDDKIGVLLNQHHISEGLLLDAYHAAHYDVYMSFAKTVATLFTLTQLAD